MCFCSGLECRSMRLFVGLDLADNIRVHLQQFVGSISGLASDVRWVGTSSWHVTLKFIGSQPDDGIDKVKIALSVIPSNPLQLTFAGYRFFPEHKPPQIFAIGIKPNPELVSLAAAVDKALVPLGIPEETRPYNPHITLARANSGATRHRREKRVNRFQRLQEKLAASPIAEFGTMTAREFFLYQSKPSAEGSLYLKIARFDLK